MSNLEQVIESCEQIADRLDECCLIIDESGRKTKNVMFKFPVVISHIDDVKDAELYDIDIEKLLFILDVEIEDVLTKLLHYSLGNGQKLEREFVPIKKWALSLGLSAPRPSTIRLPRMADYPGLVIEKIGCLTFHLPEEANELRRVAKLLAEDKKQIIEQQEKAGQSKTDDIAIDDKELTILVELAEVKDKTYSQVEIGASTSIKRGTLKDKLQRLEKIGLVYRPLGKRKGYRITDKGREIANRNQ